MTPKNFLTAVAVVVLAFGLGFVLVPDTVATLYGLALDPVGRFVAQLLGATLLGFAVLNWMGRRVHDHDDTAFRPILMANLVTDALGFVLSLLNQLSGRTSINALGWMTVLLYLLFALGAAYFLFMPQARPVARARS
jgi:hypothetical protein